MYRVLLLAALERLAFLAWGAYQDATMVPGFTDVDYLVFTDAARFVAQGGSPYDRDTYRYTPLLAWLLVPTTQFFAFGKLLFVLGDLVAGILAIKVLEKQGFSAKQAGLYVAVPWLLNPLVAAISTRGSSEGLLGVIVMLMLWCAVGKRYFWAGIATGLGVHFKIYPFIYAPTILWSASKGINIFTKERLAYIAGSCVAMGALTGVMYAVYGDEYLEHSWVHHLVRVDHRHNFSVYSTVLYYASAVGASSEVGASITTNTPSSLGVEHLAFLPQLLLSAVIIPLAFARKNIAQTMAVQTLVFVTFNKVCTSQYFIWYMVLLPFYCAPLLRASRLKFGVLAAWIGGQAWWLRGAYQLEFLGRSTFYPELFTATVGFFAINVGLIVYLIYLM